MTMTRGEPTTKYEIELSNGRKVIFIHPTQMTKTDVAKIKAYIEALEKIIELDTKK